MAERRRFFFGAPLLRALVESGATGGLAMGVLLANATRVGERLLSQSIFFLLVLTALWYAIRLRVPRLSAPLRLGRPWPVRDLLRVFVFEGIAALGLSPLMVGIWLASLALVGLLPTLWATFFGPVGLAVLIMLGAGPLFLVFRVGAHLWALWERLRERRLVWALTHTQLQLVLLFVALAGLAMAVALVGGGSRPLLDLDTWVFTILPFAGIGTVATLIGLAVVIPPALFLAWRTARRTTQRLETLAAATASIRQGAYNTRATVQGQDEVAQLQSDFNAMAAALERAMTDLQTERDKVAALLTARRELVAGVSHELRTPLATARGYLESLQRNPETAAFRHDLEVMGRELDRLQGLIDDLFALSRAEVGALALEMRSVDLAAVIHRQVELTAPLAWQRQRVRVASDVPEALPHVLADEDRLEQVLANLLRNAMQHTPPGGIVAVSAAIEGGDVALRVCDTGEGIPLDEQPRIWERFYRGALARNRDAQGAGLGLALVKELVEAMGGRVSVASQPGTGSCFTVTLPGADRAASCDRIATQP